MANGDLWILPGGQRAIEVSGTTRYELKLIVIRTDWPFPNAPITYARYLCKRGQNRYHQAHDLASVPDAPF